MSSTIAGDMENRSSDLLSGTIPYDMFEAIPTPKTSQMFEQGGPLEETLDRILPESESSRRMRTKGQDRQKPKQLTAQFAHSPVSIKCFDLTLFIRSLVRGSSRSKSGI